MFMLYPAIEKIYAYNNLSHYNMYRGLKGLSCQERIRNFGDHGNAVSLTG